jgi:hypothetical protein
VSKKNVPVDVVTDQAKATYILKSAPVEIQKESTARQGRPLLVRLLRWN